MSARKELDVQKHYLLRAYCPNKYNVKITFQLLDFFLSTKNFIFNVSSRKFIFVEAPCLEHD